VRVDPTSGEIHNLTAALAATADELQGLKQKLRIVEGQCQAKDVTISSLNEGLAITAQETASLKASITELNLKHQQELAAAKSAVRSCGAAALVLYRCVVAVFRWNTWLTRPIRNQKRSGRRFER
jgi:chromosome segregation ATPase